MWLLGQLFILQLTFSAAQYYLQDQTVGCDGVIGSGKVLDRCGECGGREQSCRVVSGIFTKRTSKAAYEYITEFPVGAKNVNITEARNTRNYLALRYADSSQSIINGNWSLDWSGDYKAAGSKVKYRKPRHHHQSGENVFIEGPLQEQIKLFLLVQTRNPGIYYTYTVPTKDTAVAKGRLVATSSAVANKLSEVDKELPKYVGDSLEHRKSAQHGSASYQWKVVNTRKCSRTCGEGHREMQVVCVLERSKVTVTEENCLNHLKPQAGIIRCNTQPCAPKWEVSEWSKCSATCGRSTQTRQVTCKQRISASQSISVYAVNCGNSNKPSTIQMCPEKVCYTWKESEWSKCSVKCGAGKRQRQVHCVDSDGNRVEDSKCIRVKPRHVERCYSSCEESWFYSEWSTEECSNSCGRGNSTRQVHCPADAGSSYLYPSKCGTKPKTVKLCEERPECTSTGEWFAGEWSGCVGECYNAYQSREIVCIEKRSGLKAVTGTDLCDQRSKPNNRQKCRPVICDKAKSDWFVTEWSQCSVTCGGGYSRRQIKCLDRSQEDSTDCSPSNKPVSTKLCSMPACPQQTSATVRDPNCQDRYGSCKVVVQARLCKLSYYNRLCCESCAYQGVSSSSLG